MKASEYLDRLSVACAAGGKPASDYRLAKVLRVTTVAVSRYRNDKGHFDEPVAIRVAELLGLDPEFVLNDIAAERSKCPEAREVWQRAARRLSGVATVLAIVFVSNFSIPRAADAAPGAKAGSIAVYYVKSLLRLLTRRASLAVAS